MENQPTFINPELLAAYISEAISMHEDYEYNLEQDAGTKDWVLTIALDNTEVDEYLYNTEAEALQDIQTLEDHGVTINKI